MSWWTKNRKKVGLAAGLLGAAFIPGAPAALASMLGGLGAGGAAAGGAAGGAAAGGAAGGLLADGALTAALTPGLSATGAGSQAAMLAAQNAGMGLSGVGMTADAAATAQGLSQGAQMGGQALGTLAKGADMAGTIAKPLMAANAATNGGLLGSAPPQPAPPPPPPSQFQPTPVASPYGSINDQPPPGIDPRQWAMMSPEQKRRFKGGMV